MKITQALPVGVIPQRPGMVDKPESEMTAEELRRKVLSDRFWAIPLIREALAVLKGTTNDALSILEILELDEASAEAELVAIEAESASQTADPARVSLEIDRARAEAYDLAGVTTKEMVVALFEKSASGDSSKVDALQAKRLIVKANNPKN
jgi:hypothetical protein